MSDDKDTTTSAPDEVSGLDLDPEAEQQAQQRLGSRLRDSREYLGLSQQLVADRTGIPRSAISDIERGVRKVDSLELRKFSLIYSKPVGYFLDESLDADPAQHLRILGRTVNGMSRDDQQKVAEYAEMVAVNARVRNAKKKS